MLQHSWGSSLRTLRPPLIQVILIILFNPCWSKDAFNSCSAHQGCHSVVFTLRLKYSCSCTLYRPQELWGQQQLAMCQAWGFCQKKVNFSEDIYKCSFFILFLTSEFSSTLYRCSLLQWEVVRRPIIFTCCAVLGCTEPKNICERRRREERRSRNSTFKRLCERPGKSRGREGLAQEERGRREAEAYFMAYIRGRGRRQRQSMPKYLYL